MTGTDWLLVTLDFLLIALIGKVVTHAYTTVKRWKENSK